MLLTLWYHFIFSNIVVVTCANNKHILVNCESWSHWCGEWVAVALVGQVCILLQTDNHQWCSGKYLFGGTHGERGARAYNGGLGAEPPAGCPWVQGQSPWWGVRGGEAPLKLKRFYVLDMQWKQQTCLTNYNSLYFGNWVNRCYSWYLSKTEVQSLQWSPGAKQLCLRQGLF